MTSYTQPSSASKTAPQTITIYAKNGTVVGTIIADRPKTLDKGTIYSTIIVTRVEWPLYGEKDKTWPPFHGDDPPKPDIKDADGYLVG